MRIFLIICLLITMVNLVSFERSDLINTRWVVFNASANLPEYLIFKDSTVCNYVFIIDQFICGNYQIYENSVEINLSTDNFISENRYYSESLSLIYNDSSLYHIRDDNKMFFYERDYTYDKDIDESIFLGRWESMEIDNEEYYIFSNDGSYIYNNIDNQLIHGEYYYVDYYIILDEKINSNLNNKFDIITDRTPFFVQF